MTPPEPVRSRRPIILASTSQSRRAILTGAGVAFAAEAADVDERQLEAELGGAGPERVALVLSEAKALDVSRRHPDAMVIGADQTLGLDARAFHKPADKAAARAQLIDLRGQTHRLYSGIACAAEGRIVFRHVATAAMTMRQFSDRFLDSYLDMVGDAVLKSVGCYQLEGPGMQLFERIDGDYFTILGLPLLPLLAALRSHGCIDD